MCNGQKIFYIARCCRGRVQYKKVFVTDRMSPDPTCVRFIAKNTQLQSLVNKKKTMRNSCIYKHITILLYSDSAP